MGLICSFSSASKKVCIYNRIHNMFLSSDARPKLGGWFYLATKIRIFLKTITETELGEPAVLGNKMEGGMLNEVGI